MARPLTVGAALAGAQQRLEESSLSPRIDALRLLELVLKRNVAWLFAHPSAPLAPAAVSCFEAKLERRACGEPLAYIAGSIGFYGRTFAVSPAVLVPRPESEHIVTLALEQLGARDPKADVRICDVGTGSGCLAISLALELAGARVVGIDVSPGALGVAAQNARALGVEGRVRLLRGDMFEPLSPLECFDCIVANLPYVATGDLAPAPDATSFEPRLALDGGADGLQSYRALLASAPDRLAERGVLLMEAGPNTAQALAEMARNAFGARVTVAVAADYARRERVVSVRRS